MKHAFLSKNEIKFINRKITSPTEYGPLFDIWERCNNIVIAWISVQSTIYVDNAAQLWTDLHNRFFKIDHFRLSYLLQQIHYMHQGEKSIMTYFNELKTLSEDLETLRVLPTCTCGAHATIKKRRDMEYLICFLKGLNDNFNNIKSQILMIESFPNVSKVYSSIMQEEFQLTSPFSSDNSNTLLS